MEQLTYSFSGSFLGSSEKLNPMRMGTSVIAANYLFHSASSCLFLPPLNLNLNLLKHSFLIDLDLFANFLSKKAVSGPSTAGIPADIEE